MYTFDFELDDFQKEAINHIENGKSVVVCAPTGAGKTCIAEFAIMEALKKDQRIFYTTPLKALSNQKYRDFSKRFGEDKVGLLTGDMSLNRGSQIVIMTTEVFRNMLYGTNFGSLKDNLSKVRYVVLDEVHYMNDEQRGTVWEESIIYCPSNIQIVALSATVANADQLTDWINSVHSKTETVFTDFRPVPLRYYYFDSSKPNNILPLMTQNGSLNSKITPEKRVYGARRKSNQKSYVKNILKILNEKGMLPAIYFTFSRKKCDEQMEKAATLELITKREELEIKSIVNQYLIDNPHLYNNKNLEYIYKGVASHHAGLLPSLKALIEKLFQKGLIKVIFATETLAAGINMPARTCVISSISKRTDSGHRVLTANEFLQMSGRAGRRGMDEVGYVVVVGTQYQAPEEVVKLVKSDANPLESKFAPGYSMVVNLLQRFSLDEAKELILKSFGYFSSSSRLKPLILQKEELVSFLENANKFSCKFNFTNNDLYEFNKIRQKYITDCKTVKILKKQNTINGKIEDIKVLEFIENTQALLKKMKSYKCLDCKQYKKHMKKLEVTARYKKRLNQLEKQIRYEKDIYWQKFINHKKVLEEYGYIENDYPNEKGLIVGALRSENELFIAEVINSELLNDLNAYELASVMCALMTEDMRADLISRIPISKNVRIVLSKIKNIKKKLSIIQADNNIETPIYINSFYSPLIEQWMLPESDWSTLSSQVEIGEGDIVRSFKRTIDILRQLTIINNVDPKIVETAREAIDLILKEPINLD